DSDVAIEQVELPPLQGFARDAFAGHLASGKLNVHAKIMSLFDAAHFNVHVAPASISIDSFKVEAPGGKEVPVEWKQFSTAIDQVDLASHQASVKEVRADGLNLFVRRGKKGDLNLLALARTAPTPTPATRKKERVAKSKAKPVSSPTPAGPEWQFKV